MCMPALNAVSCDDKIKFTIMEQLHHFASNNLADKDVITIDGIRVQDESGWWLIRASNTKLVLLSVQKGVTKPAWLTKSPK